MISTSHTYESIDLFPTLVLRTNLGRNFSIKEKDAFNKCLTKCEKKFSWQVAITADHFVLNQKGLGKLKGEILQHVKNYIQRAYHPRQPSDIKPYITQSWMNVCQQGDRHHEHHHPNSFISGVLYIDTCDQDYIQFNSLRGKTDQIRIDSIKWEKYNAASWNVMVNNMDLLLFPSTLQHQVPYKDYEGQRISLSFNTFLSGKLGMQKGLNALEL